jgi:4-hydroxy-tetrahydrodipicolinate reductase
VKIALIGYGKMGREVEQVARKGGHVIAARIDPASDVAVTSEISSQTIGSANVCIEFTHPEAAFGKHRESSPSSKATSSRNDGLV